MSVISMKEDDREWHLDKRINVAHIVATIGMMVAIFSWVSTTDRRLALIEERLNSQREMGAQIQKANTEQISVIRDEFRNVKDEILRTNQKLERLLENQANSHRRITP